MASNLQSTGRLPRRFRVLALLGASSAMTYYSYRNLRNKNPQSNKEGVWKPFMDKAYPVLINSVNHDLLHRIFMKAAAAELLPTDWSKEPISKKRTSSREFFGSNLGVKTGLIVMEDGKEVDGIFDMSKALSYVELGPTAVDVQQQKSQWPKRYQISLDPSETPLRIHSSSANLSCKQMASLLVERQEQIRIKLLEAGTQAPNIHSDRRIGVCIEANESTLDRAPDLAHQDFMKQVKELTGLCDYVILNISGGRAKKPGLTQYYQSPDALERLLKNCSTTRLAELGKHAALQFEEASGGKQADDATAMKNYYKNSSVVSTLKPMALFLKMDPFSAEGVEDPLQKAREMAEVCLSNDIEGIVVGCHSGKPEDLAGIIKEIRKTDSKKELVIVAEGCEGQGMRTGAEADLYLEAGADSCSMLSRLFTEGPFAPESIQRELNESIKK